MAGHSETDITHDRKKNWACREEGKISHLINFVPVDMLRTRF